MIHQRFHILRNKGRLIEPKKKEYVALDKKLKELNSQRSKSGKTHKGSNKKPRIVIPRVATLNKSKLFILAKILI